MNLDAWRLTRHDLLVHAGRALAGLAGLALIGRAREARAAKVHKEDVAYQDKPKDGKTCASCRQFSPTAEGKGSCAVVEGEVSASGWCNAYSPRGMQSRAERARVVAVTKTARTEKGVQA